MKNSITYIILIVLTFLFFGLLLYFLFTNNSKIVKFRVIEDDNNNILTDEEYIDIKTKYDINKCTDICKKEFCCEFEVQQIKYDMCKECNKISKCYDENKGICVNCKNNYTCEQLFGCGNGKPIEPSKNFCTKCWH